LLRPPAQRLTRVRDELLHVEVWREPRPVHLRVWHGPAPEGRRTVVLLGELLGGASVNAHLEEIVRAAAGLLPVSPREAVWFGYRPGDELRPQEVDNLIWRPTSDDEDRAPSAGGRVRHFFRRTAPVRRADQVPRYHRPASLPEVERIVGSPVEAYPGPAYTPETIEAWQRTGRQVEVVRDSIGFESLLTAAVTLEWTKPSIHDVERLAVLNAAVHLLVDDLRERLAWLQRGGWDDGTKPSQERKAPPTWPTTWAARLVKPQPGGDQQRLLESYPDPFEVPRDPAEHGPLHQLLEQLRRWSQEVDRYADHPDEQRHAALETADGLLAFYLGVYDQRFRENDHPDSDPRLHEVTGPWDRAYLGQLTPADVTEQRRAHRVLTEKIRPPVAEPALLRTGCDPAGRLVVHYPGDPGQTGTELYAVEWPLRPPAAPIPAGTRIVADAARGDRPAYLAYPDGRIEPLPAPPNEITRQWNFGYSGGGPGALTNAITSTFARADGIDREQMPRSWISDQVEYVHTGDHLEVSVDELRRRYPAA
jgi:hypothetical protein